MRIKLLSIFVLTTAKYLLPTLLFAQVPNWQWAKSTGKNTSDGANSISTDTSRNSYVTGYFASDTMIFGNDTLINSSSYIDIFVVKYDSMGNVLWAKGGNGAETDEANSISIDVNGNSYITGYFDSDTLIFGSDTLINAYAGTYDIFIVKYDNAGNVLWAKSAGGNNDDKGNSISTDANGNSYVTGIYSSNAIIFGSYTLPNWGSSGDVFVVKYDSAGNVLWAKSAGAGPSVAGYDTEGYGIASDANGNSYITGYFDYDSIAFGNYTLTNSTPGGDADIFIVKYDSMGNVKWAKNPSGIGYDRGKGICVDVNGNSYITGSFQSNVIVFGNTALTNTSGYADIFVVKYDSAGNVVWAKSGNGLSSDFGAKICVDATGNSYVTGSFSSFSLSFGNTTLTNAGSADIFVVKYDASGNVVYAKNAGGIYYSYGDVSNGISIDANSQVYVAGYFASTTITFGSIALTNSANNGWSSDIFIAKLDSMTSATNGTTEASNTQYELNIFPNPTHGIFTIQSSERTSEIEIMNVLGEKIHAEFISASLMSIDISSQSNGVYFLTLKTTKESYTKKLIIQK